MARGTARLRSSVSHPLKKHASRGGTRTASAPYAGGAFCPVLRRRHSSKASSGLFPWFVELRVASLYTLRFVCLRVITESPANSNAGHRRDAEPRRRHEERVWRESLQIGPLSAAASSLVCTPSCRRLATGFASRAMCRGVQRGLPSVLASSCHSGRSGLHESTDPGPCLRFTALLVVHSLQPTVSSLPRLVIHVLVQACPPPVSPSSRLRLPRIISSSALGMSFSYCILCSVLTF